MSPQAIGGGAAGRASRTEVTASVVFSHAVCIVVLLLQRFGLPVGEGFIFLGLVLVPPMIVGLLMTGRGRIRGATALIYMFMACCFLASAVSAVSTPDPRMRFSLFSITELFVLYGILLVEPTKKFDSRRVLRVVVFYIRILAICGILQYALQFVHIRLFAFRTMFPPIGRFTAEFGFNTEAIIKYGSPILRSNGFFLLEPSIFSQVLVIGIVVDFFVLSRKLFLPVYAVALLASYSGTGPLALAITLAVVGVLSPRQLGRTAGLAVIGIIAVGLAAVVFPTEFSALSSRASGQDASAHARYAGQLEIMQTVINDPRIVFGFGPGAADGYAGASGSMSPALKLAFDYGVFGMSAFVAFLLTAVWRADKPILSVISLVIFQTGGGELVFPPYVFLMALLCIWSKPAVEVRQPSRSRGLQPFATRRDHLAA